MVQVNVVKKKIWIIILISFLLTACGTSKQTADKRLVGTLDSTMGEQTFSSTIKLEYNSEDETLIAGVFKYKYDNLEKTQTNNNILADFINRQTMIDQIDGVEVEADVTDTSFDFEEKWNYNLVDIDKALEADEEQKNFIENDKYSLKKIKEYYEKQGYSFKEKDIKQQKYIEKTIYFYCFQLNVYQNYGKRLQQNYKNIYYK